MAAEGGVRLQENAFWQACEKRIEENSNRAFGPAWNRCDERKQILQVAERDKGAPISETCELNPSPGL